MADGMSKKELKEMRKIEETRRKNIENKSSMVKWISIGAIVTVFVGFCLFLVVSLKNSNPNLSKGSDAETVRNFSDSGEFRIKEGSIAPIDARLVTLVEFADLQCPACQQYHPIIKALLDIYPESLAVSFKHFPISSIHKNAIPSAVAAEAANNQNKFFEMVDLLYERQAEWSNLPDATDKFSEYAKELELDMGKFSADLNDESLKKKIDDQRNEGIGAGVNATPTFFVNGVFINNPSDISGFQAVIDEILNTSEKKTVPSETATPSADSTGSPPSAEDNTSPQIDL